MNALILLNKVNNMKHVSRLVGVHIDYFYIIGCRYNNKMYVGTTENPKHRYKSHIYALRNNRHPNAELQKDFNRYGEKGFVFKIIDASTVGRRYKKEKEWMERLRTYDPEYGYNNHDVYFRRKNKI